MAACAMAQDGFTVVAGRVVSGGKGVPYATLQLAGTSVGVSCNDAGEFEMRIPAGCGGDTVLVRSLGYRQAMTSLRELAASRVVKLERQPMELREVKVESYASGRNLIIAAVERIGSNCHQSTAWSTFFYRDWRAVDGELYLFDEAVMQVERGAYSQYANKMGYVFDTRRREMATNYKRLLRHRLVVFDRRLVQDKVSSRLGVDEVMEYADNEEFFDPLSTPQASFMLAKRILGQHKFEPVAEFTADGEVFYLVRSIGPSRIPNAKVSYEYTVRKRDLAIVRLTSSQRPVTRRAPEDSWVNVYFTRIEIEQDTSAWVYDVREGRYTLTHYYNSKSLTLGAYGPGSLGHDGERQNWQQCVDWTLTDFAFSPSEAGGDSIDVRPQTLTDAFGSSDYNADFWGRYNRILIDRMPLRLLEEKLKKLRQ